MKTSHQRPNKHTMLHHCQSSIYLVMYLFFSIACNGWRVCAVAVSKHFPVKLQAFLIRAETFDNPLTAKCFIYDALAFYL
jgi:hypothetical protein